jgi:uncharacterized membrane protein YkoI
MKQTVLTLLMSAAVTCLPGAAKSLQLKDLPASVQKMVQETLKGAEIKNIAKEVENGVTQYEVETVLNGKRRDFNVDVKGKLLVVEEETTLDTLPAAVKAAILKKVGDGKLGMVELVIADGQTKYEAAYTTKAGKKQGVLVNGDGTEAKN